ncbi:hypothetical protein E2562_037277 [Oryza meyeriana var. granulata]|uniref:Uncharacterized protein n=1 Tax=Oryza meyeriana var. granulata TaxID=110450 RepID=A0A6G1C2N0_9ORYZ|nr:hypothetical protein E2562_037277 [Oryza meyeriana var. granulata]
MRKERKGNTRALWYGIDDQQGRFLDFFSGGLGNWGCVSTVVGGWVREGKAERMARFRALLRWVALTEKLKV